MPFKVVDGAGPIVTAKISGEISKADVSQMQQASLEAIRRCGKISALFVLDNFQGWKREAGWGDLTFLDAHDKDILKIAVVGEEKWKDLVCAFLAKGLRRAKIEYFSPSEPHKAREWLRQLS